MSARKVSAVSTRSTNGHEVSDRRGRAAPSEQAAQYTMQGAQMAGGPPIGIGPSVWPRSAQLWREDALRGGTRGAILGAWLAAPRWRGGDGGEGKRRWWKGFWR